MKISSRRRSATFPLDGITFSAAERRTAMEMAQALAALPPEALAAVKEALAYSSLRLEEAADWTTPGSDQEADRAHQHEWALLTLHAADNPDPAARATLKLDATAGETR